MSGWPIARARLVRNLSYGEQKLLTVARVLATGAELLLLDEPASGLSAGALDAVMALLRRLQTEGKTLLVVEHNTRVVQQIADEVLFLHQGHLMARGIAGRRSSAIRRWRKSISAGRSDGAAACRASPRVMARRR